MTTQTDREFLIDLVAVKIAIGDMDDDDARRINAGDGFTYDRGSDEQWTRHEGAHLTDADLEAAIAKSYVIDTRMYLREPSA
jgi:hypothetical protein